MCKLHLVTGLSKAHCHPRRHVCKPAPDSLCLRVGSCDPEVILSWLYLNNEDSSPTWCQSTFRLFREPPDLTNTPGTWREAEALYTPICPVSECHHHYPFSGADHVCMCITGLCNPEQKMIARAPGQGTPMSCIAYPLWGLEVFQASASDSAALR